MRIPSRTPWLVTSVIANVAATDSFNFTQSSFVGFPSGDLTTSVFDISSLDYKQFSWVMTTSVTIQSIYLGIQNTSIVVGENKTVSGTPYGGSIQNRDATIPLQFNGEPHTIIAQVDRRAEADCPIKRLYGPAEKEATLLSVLKILSL